MKGRKWKVIEVVDQVKECVKIEAVIEQTQTGRKELGSSTTNFWPEAEGKKKKYMIINEIRLNEDPRGVHKPVQQQQEGHWTNWDIALKKNALKLR